MKGYKEILADIQRLQQQAAKRRSKEIGAVIAGIRQEMADYGITLEELQGRWSKSGKAHGSGNAAKLGRPAGRKAAKPKNGAKRKVKPKYRNPATGVTWSGRGLTPKWLAEKEKAGAKREQFLIEGRAGARAPR